MLATPQPLASKFPAIVHIYTDVLRVLANSAAPLTPSQLATATNRDKSNVRRDLKKLEEAGVVTIDAAGAFITDDGIAWVRGQRVAEGLESEVVEVFVAGPVEDAPPRAGHANFRPNPDQPRKDFDEAEIRAIADTIVADAEAGGGGVLQALLVRPRDPSDPLDGDDANPVRMIWAGEKRWRAMGLLIDEGRLPAALDPARGGGIDYKERPEPPGGAAFLALVENGARSDLDPLDEAYAFLDYVTRTGVSARQAAIDTGRAARGEGGVRTVQIRLKVAREATTDAIARYRETRDWNELVATVQQSSETPEERREREIRKGVAGLMGRRRLALIELAHKAVMEPDDSGTGRSAVIHLPSYTEPTGAVTALLQHAGAVFSNTMGRLSDVAKAWLIEESLLDPDNPRTTLAAAWRDHGLLDSTIEDRLSGAAVIWSTEWLNLPPPPAEPEPEEVPLFAPPAAGANRPPRPLADILPGRSVITLAEILHLSGDGPDVAALPQARAGKYWLDANVSTMKDAGLIVILHEPGQPPFIRVTDAGIAALSAALAERSLNWGGSPVTATALDMIRWRWGQGAWPGQGMVTEWLNVEPLGETSAPIAQPSPTSDQAAASVCDDDSRTAEDILGVSNLWEVDAGLQGDVSAAYLFALFARVGFRGPFAAAAGEQEEGLIRDDFGRWVLTCDVEGDEPAAMARAQAVVIAAALNAACGFEPAGEPA